MLKLNNTEENILKAAEFLQRTQLINFIKESNKIEGINRQPTQEEIDEYIRFMELKSITIKDLAQFTRVYQPNAQLRDKPGLNVRVGNHIPIPGGSLVKEYLDILLAKIDFQLEGNISQLERRKIAYDTHIEYENLHPFTDGNGRTGRMIWMWIMRDAPLGFLHTFYYQTLAFGRFGK